MVSTFDGHRANLMTNGFNMLNLGANWQGLIEGIVVVVAAMVFKPGA